MKRVFGKKKQSAPAPTLDQASEGLGGRIDGMDKKIADLEGELRVYKDKIKKTKSPAAKKQLQKRALEVLKRKRMYEQQRDTVSGQQFNIDQANFGLESAKASISTVAAMKAANKELKQTIKKDLDIDEVDDLADDMAELMDDFNGECSIAYYASCCSFRIHANTAPTFSRARNQRGSWTKLCHSRGSGRGGLGCRTRHVGRRTGRT